MKHRPLAPALLLVLPLLLSGCWVQDDDAAATAPSAGAPSPPVASTPASTDASVAAFEHNGVTVTGPLGAEPTITLAKDFKAVTDLDVADVVVGTGAEVGADNVVTVHYVGMGQQTREVFDSSWDADPETFDLTGVIPGFGAGLLGMKEGGRRLLIIPGSMAYGADGNPPKIQPDETLVFVVDLISVS